MTDGQIKSALVDRNVLALTMFGEARNQGIEGIVAVGSVVRNRLKAPGRYLATEPTYKGVCLARHQFSCWMKEGGAANYAVVMSLAERLLAGLPAKNPLFEECLFLADGIMRNVLLDNTGSATAYYAPQAMSPVGAVPTWAQGKSSRRIGDQEFLNV